MFLNLGPTSAADLRALADQAEADWADWEAHVAYTENARQPEPIQEDCAADARFLGQVPAVDF